jgi:hypothetical protein
MCKGGGITANEYGTCKGAASVFDEISVARFFLNCLANQIAIPQFLISFNIFMAANIAQSGYLDQLHFAIDLNFITNDNAARFCNRVLGQTEFLPADFT